MHTIKYFSRNFILEVFIFIQKIIKKEKDRIKDKTL